MSIICMVAIGVVAVSVLSIEIELQARGCKMQHVLKTIAENTVSPPHMQPIEPALISAPMMADFLELRPALAPQDINTNIEFPYISAISDLEPCTVQELIPAPDALPTEQPHHPETTTVSVSNKPTESVYTPPQYIYTPQPEYPAELQRRRIAGEVRVRIHVDATGKAQAVDILTSPHPKLSLSAQHTILHFWRFRAAMRGKNNVSATVITSVLFEL